MNANPTLELPVQSPQERLNVVIPAGMKTAEHHGIIYAVLPETTGWTGEYWIQWFKDNSYPLGAKVEKILRSDSFVPTTGVSYAIAAIRSAMWPSMMVTEEHVEVQRALMRFSRLPVEATCMARQFFADEELRQMRVHWLMNMHKPVELGDGPLFTDVVLPMQQNMPAVDSSASVKGARFNEIGAFMYGLSPDSFAAIVEAGEQAA